MVDNTTNQEKEQLLQMSEISLLLDTYDDIFSDFDPRPYSHRALSEDFISESKRASKEKGFGKIDLKLLIPASKRDVSQETMIKKRLKEHFKKHHTSLQKKNNNIMIKGIAFTVVGMFLMLAATTILFIRGEESFIINFLIVFLEPSGWFLFWEGANIVVFERGKTKPKLNFYKKMARCEISFLPY